MGIWDKIRGEFVDIVQWLDDSPDTMVWRFERYNNEIKYGAKLIVRPSQAAVVVHEGQLADVFTMGGTYTMETKNLPLLSTLQGWKYGFESPFKCEVYFVNLRKFTNQKWGTKNPIMLRDAEFGPVRLRAFGTYAVCVSDPARFVQDIVGTGSHFTTGEIIDQLRNMIVARFSDLLGESKIPALDLAARYDELSAFVSKKLADEFGDFGLSVTNLLVENISLPPEVEAAMDKRSSMGVIGDLNNYTQFQAANAMEDAAKNPSGVAAGGIGIGMGIAMAKQAALGLAQGGTGVPPVNGGTSVSPGAVPPPLPNAVQFYAAIGGQQAGPFDQATIQQQIAAGKINATTLVWKQGMAQWTPAGDVPELASLLAAVPPPLPPQQ